MLKIVLAGAVAIPVAATAMVAATGVAVVDVREGHGGSHIIVPVPLVLAQAAAAFVPAHKARLHLGHDADRYLPVARDVLSALARSADGELVRVEEPGTDVRVLKEGRTLKIHVQDRDEQVDVSLPLDMALAVLPDAGGRLDVSSAVWALQRARFTQLVDVQGRDGERVKVTVF